MSSSLQRWHYIEQVYEDGLNSRKGCHAETSATHIATHSRLRIVLCSHCILGFHVHLNSAHNLTLKPIESILVCHSGSIIVAPARCGENDFVVFSFEKK